ncbi:hypothetical protein AB0C59_01215 [Streptomyces sp. NPDC048664]|uniref:hypothetical protein n=1 Tax=Streptomyces sp. NPDC048664 TaxID=3154505 RepID=UPI00343B252A
MSRLSREHRRGPDPAQAAPTGAAEAGATPIEVRVPVVPGGPAGAFGPGATVDGVPVVAGAGEALQEAVLNHLHRVATAAGRPVLATVHDERIGFVVPIRVRVDGSSEFAGEPTRLDPPATATPAPVPGTGAPVPHPSEAAPPTTGPGHAPELDRPTHVLRALGEQRPAPAQAAPGPPTPAAASRVPHQQEPTPADRGPAPSPFVSRPAPEQNPFTSAPSGPARPLPEHGTAPTGTVSPPTGVFGPPPPTGPAAQPAPAPVWRAPETGPDEPKTLRPDFGPDPVPEAETEFGSAHGLGPRPSDAQPAPAPAPAPRHVSFLDVARGGEEEEEVKEPPVREFDSVAEAVLAPDPGAESPGAAGGPYAGSMARISAAVRQGRIEEAAGLAAQTSAEASASLGDDHPDALHLRELTAYVAYLAQDPLRSFQLSLDLARLRHRLRDPRGAYGNVQSAAAAWRAVRDPIQGLELGGDLIALWSELAAGEGPAAQDLEQLEKARGRMGRLAERARAH